MTPGFALSLSIDGIVLLARAAGGWRVAGRVALDADDLAAELAALRNRAVELGDPAYRTKLIIPNDQIRYLSVDTGHVATADRITKVRQALDGATPYPVEQLVYDICVDGPMTHVAAVARETLEEAEAFALEHRFHPISFVAIPDSAAFLGEPFFGPTAFSEKALGPGQRVEADGIAVVIVGNVEDAPETIEQDVAAELAKADSVTAPTFKPEPKGPEAPAQTESADTTNDEGEAERARPGFASRRGSGAPALGGANRSTIAPRIEDDEAEAPTPDPAVLSASLAGPEIPEDKTGDEAEPAQGWAARFFSRRSAPAEAPGTPEPAPVAATVAVPKAPAPIPARPKEPPRKLPVMAAPPAQTVATAEGTDERTRMTIFGMRDEDEVGGAPRHLGLILTAVLLVFLAGVAAWATLFLDDGVVSLFDRDEPIVSAPLPETFAPEVETAVEDKETAPVEAEDIALSDTDAAVLDALRDEPEPEAVEDPEPLPTTETAEARYAVTGIWQKAPDAPGEPGVVSLDDLYITSIDAAVDARDAIALPAPDGFDTDQPLGQVSSPAAPNSQFVFDENGRVVPTPEGTLSPDGFTVVLGPPPLVPPPTPPRDAALDVDETAETAALQLPNQRPRTRPADLAEQTQRSQLGGLTLSELSGVRPQLRPEVEKSEDEADETPTAQAVQASMSPRLRPVNMDQLVAAARNAQQRATQSQVAAASTAAVAAATPTRTVAATTVTPRIPSSASVARAATVNNAINLRRVNLIGVYGTQANRRALVRMPNGRYRKVEVGDRLDGGRISAIGENELRYQKGGRNIVLRMPSG